VKIGISARSQTLFGNVMGKKLCFEKSGDEVEIRDFAILWSSWDTQETGFPGDLVFPNKQTGSNELLCLKSGEK
jgi:hypothetical protein